MEILFVYSESCYYLGILKYGKVDGILCNIKNYRKQEI